MGIRALCAASAVVAGVGAAEAATTKDYDLYLRYEGTAFTDYVFYDGRNDFQDYSGDLYPSSDPLDLNVPHAMFPTMAVGDIVRFIATIFFPDDQFQNVGEWSNGGEAPICSIGQTSCTNTEAAFQLGAHDAFMISHADEIFIRGSTQIGSEFSYSQWSSSSGNYEVGEWTYFARFADAFFTVVDIVDTPAPSPVPLPATAALLPLGIGAFAMMRRRRRLS